MPENLRGGYYDECGIGVAYERDEGLVQMPVGAARADSSVPCRIARVHAPIMVKVVFVTATKKGGPPTLPNYVPDDTNLVLMGVAVANAVPVLLPSGAGHTWAVTATYRYAMRKPLVFGKDELPLGMQPYEFGAPATNRLPASQFKNLLDGHAGAPNQLPPQQLLAT